MRADQKEAKLQEQVQDEGRRERKLKYLVVQKGTMYIQQVNKEVHEFTDTLMELLSVQQQGGKVSVGGTSSTKRGSSLSLWMSEFLNLLSP